MDTIFALSSGAPPAGIGVIRVTGPGAKEALLALTGKSPTPRVATRAQFRDSARELIDDGLILFFEGPRSVTGEDLAELHCHGGRAVIAAIEAALGQVSGCRRALPGEFTRRAFANGRIDLAEAEGLADLLSAETQIQRRSALITAGGRLSRQVEGWRETLLMLSAQIEAVLDFEDEDDVTGLPESFAGHLATLHQELTTALMAPRAELLREGFRVALAGPPNAGKSTLFNALTDSEAAITAELAGTTRDVLERPVALGGIPYTFVDMAGLRERGADPIEAIGIERATTELKRADLVLWLGPEGAGPKGAWEIAAQCDRAETEHFCAKKAPDFRLSAVTGDGLDDLRAALIARARSALPGPSDAALNQRQRGLISEARRALAEALAQADQLLLAECLRQARSSFDALLGRTATEDVLDALFGRFCIGK